MILSDLAINSDGTILVDKGDIVKVSDADTVIQMIKQKLEVSKGEWYLDQFLGVEYKQEVFEKNRVAEATAELLKQILDTNGVDSISDYTVELNPVSREYKLTCKLAIFGEFRTFYYGI